MTASDSRDPTINRFFSLATDLMCIIGFDGTLRRANPALERVLGRTEAELQAGSILDNLPPEDRPAIEEQLRHPIALDNLEVRSRCADGAYRWFSWSAQPDELTGEIYAVGRDITERKHADAARAASEKRQAFLLRLSDAMRPLEDPIAVQEVACRLLGEYLGTDRAAYGEFRPDNETMAVARDWTSPGTASAIGDYRIDDFGTFFTAPLRAGKPSTVNDAQTDPRISPEMYQQTWAAIGVRAGLGYPLFKHGRFVAAIFLHQSGPRAWSEDDLSLVAEVGERTWASVERARAEEALRFSEERLQLALDASGMGTFVWYPREDRGEPDARMLHLFGQPANGTLTLKSALASMIHPDDRARYDDSIRRAIDPAGPGTLRDEIRLVQPDSTYRWVDIFGQVHFEGDPPRAVRMPGLVADISERKRAEEERERLLAAAEEERNRAEAAVQARDEFLSIASHELRNPIAAIKATAQLMQRLIGRDRLDEQRLSKYTRIIVDTSGRLSLLVDDLLDVSRLQTGWVPLHLQPTDLAELVRAAADAGRISAGDARLQFDITGNPMLQLDPERITQVIVNLLDNAIKYSPDSDAVRILLTDDAKGALLRVQDQGIGLPEGASESIFRPFGRAANAASSQIQGMGLGLFIARRIAEAHGGKLWAESAGEGKGTTMYLWLPSRAGETHEPSTPGAGHRR